MRIEKSHGKRWEDTAGTWYSESGYSGIIRIGWHKPILETMWRRHLTTFSEAVSAYEEPRHIVGLPDEYTNLISGRAQFHLEVTTLDMKSTSWLLETKARMTFHLAPSNPLIITAAAEAQRLHLCCISGCHGKKKKKILHPTSILCRQRENNLSTWGNWRSASQKHRKPVTAPRVCVSVCVLGWAWKKNHTGIF